MKAWRCNLIEFDEDHARTILAATLLRALEDAIGRGPGCTHRITESAREWLAADGALWAEELGLSADMVRAWAASPGQFPRHNRSHLRPGAGRKKKQDAPRAYPPVPASAFPAD